MCGSCVKNEFCAGPQNRSRLGTSLSVWRYVLNQKRAFEKDELLMKIQDDLANRDS